MTSQIEEGDGEWEPMARDGVLTPGCRWSILSSEDSVQVQNDEWVTEVDLEGWPLVMRDSKNQGIRDCPPESCVTENNNRL